ncbi:MobC family plasmid mobilization relaxosome protein [Methylobacterium sp. E-065]|uniref:MobC family plasmid mobilization relaxosome protein n=1 Tax=Methylobacterium sp. E-065 TaxID=2836583 RepID=UPI001FBB0FA4|nr:MobC family plasmid mobilization relaxosome protein [Methylobacterium sp. E-065]MCJ2015880.1 MobC family plasmid mobilization relaxosome protein [Methylobacterium sp. E-065]
MARPKKAFDEVRGTPLGVRLTVAERAELDATAELYGLTAAEFMRRRSLGYRLPPTQAAARSEAVIATALMRLGVNLNQVAKHLNAGRPVKLPVIEDLARRINAALDRLYDARRDENRPQL